MGILSFAVGLLPFICFRIFICITDSETILGNVATWKMGSTCESNSELSERFNCYKVIDDYMDGVGYLAKQFEPMTWWINITFVKQAQTKGNVQPV